MGSVLDVLSLFSPFAVFGSFFFFGPQIAISFALFFTIVIVLRIDVNSIKKKEIEHRIERELREELEKEPPSGPNLELETIQMRLRNISANLNHVKIQSITPESEKERMNTNLRQTKTEVDSLNAELEWTRKGEPNIYDDQFIGEHWSRR